MLVKANKKLQFYNRLLQSVAIFGMPNSVGVFGMPISGAMCKKKN